MSYFGKRVGERPGDRPEGESQAAPTKRLEQTQPYFAANLGPRPVEATDTRVQQAQIASDTASTHTIILSSCHLVKGCPLCRGPLEDDSGLYRCAGRCGSRWLEQSPGRLVDLAALPLGVCACCHPPVALARSPEGAVCPASESAYVMLGEGPKLLALAAPDGLCRCCAPAVPLARRGTRLCCSSKPEHTYQRIGEEVVLLSANSTLTPAETLEAIDAALRRNSARLTVNGLFDIE